MMRRHGLFAIPHFSRWTSAPGLILGLLATAVVVAGPPISPEQEEFFEKQVRPVLAEHCYRCHGPKRQKAGLRLDAQVFIEQGGESGPVIAAGDPDKSRLIQAVRFDGDLHMPPSGKLKDDEIAALTAWVRMGAPWPVAPAESEAAVQSQPAEDFFENIRKTHWSFQPVGDPPVPAAHDDADGRKQPWITTPVDAFVLARLEEKGLSPSPPADRRTLIRRAAYDLTGLPPDPAEIEAFVSDSAPDAYARLVDRLLASPHYGERWGRHWLDVARYADSKGYVFNEDRRYVYSYTYRDYVIRAFNEDKPFDRFIIEQLAADQLDPGEDNNALAAMGFLTLGRRFTNNIHDIIDDRIDVVSRGLQGLTVSCARCHDHKYDPVPIADYYSLYGVFNSSIEPVDLPMIGKVAETAAYADYLKELEARKKAHDEYAGAEHEKLLNEFRVRVGDYLLKLLEPRNTASAATVYVYSAGDIRWQVVDRWEEHLKKGAARHDPVFEPWRVLRAIRPDGFAAEAVAAIAGLAARSASGSVVNALVLKAFQDKPPASMSDVAGIYGGLFADVHKQWMEALAAHAKLASAEPKAGQAGATDPPSKLPDPAAEELRQVLYGPESPVIVDANFAYKQYVYDGPITDKIGELRRKIDEWQQQSKVAPPRAHVLIDRPRPIEPAVFIRGNPAAPGAIVPRQYLKVVSGEQRRPFSKGSGRLELAKLIADPSNPLTARVLVNRVWLHHFGAGLVRTPSDFGTRGEPPTHPELLDWLARRFMAEGWSIKKLHRLIMLSSTYQQSSAEDSRAAAVDPENRLLWRMNRRRLEFEPLRDSLLAVAGRLDPAMGGPPVEIAAAPYTPRRTVYGYIDRQNLPAMFRIFDFASPDTTNSQRFTTTVPQQALFMMNSELMIDLARQFAARPEVQAACCWDERIQSMQRTALGRPASTEELARSIEFIREAQRESLAFPPAPVWQYGYGEFDLHTQRLKSFHAFKHWTGDAWRISEAFPDPQFGHLFVTRGAGHAGGNLAQSPVNRWRSPLSGLVEVEGTFAHSQGEKQGDGVRARIISSRHGELGQWFAHNSSAQTRVWNIAVEPGDTLDFMVDCHKTAEFDGWNWNPIVRLVQASATQPAGAADGAAGDRRQWSQVEDFAGPPPKPLSAWERFAQVLLMTNEFAFVD